MNKTDKVVLVTGCSSGIGKAIAELLATAGCTVVATARKLEDLAGLTVAKKMILDVCEKKAFEQIVDVIVRELGRIDVVINNAGFAIEGAIEELSHAQLQSMLDVNLFGVLTSVQSVVPHMRKQKSGQIINIGSIAGRWASPFGGGYCMTKHALVALSDSLRQELHPFGISVVLIEPGPVKSRFDEKRVKASAGLIENPDSPYALYYQRYNEIMVESRKSQADPEEIAQVVLKAVLNKKSIARCLVGVPAIIRVILALSPAKRDTAFARIFVKS